jgi:hypothetical protein
LALGLGLAFGLGGRETAADIVRRFYLRMRGDTLARPPRATSGIEAHREH